MLMNLRTFAARGEAGITDSGDSSDFEMSRVSALRFGKRVSGAGITTSTPSTTTSISWARGKFSSGKKYFYTSTISTMSTTDKTDLGTSSGFDSESVGLSLGVTSESIRETVALPTLTFALPPHNEV